MNITQTLKLGKDVYVSPCCEMLHLTADAVIMAASKSGVIDDLIFDKDEYEW